MKALILLANPQSEASFCGAIALTVLKEVQKTTNDVIVRDLYAEKFDPILTHSELTTPNDELSGYIREQIQELLDCDLLVVVHPNWWGMPPAILTGYIDRVMRQGFCYAFCEEGAIQKLKGKKLMVFVTANTPEEVEIQFNHDPLRNLWTNVIPSTVGFAPVEYTCYSSVIMSDEAQREAWLTDAAQKTRNMIDR